MSNGPTNNYGIIAIKLVGDASRYVYDDDDDDDDSFNLTVYFVCIVQ